MKMNIFQQLFKSLYSPKDIALFRFQGIGKTILYVFFLTLLSVIPTLYYLNTAIVNSVETMEESLNNDLPDFSIENGELQADIDAPITLNKGDLTIIFDSTGTVNPDTLNKHRTTVALLKDEFVYIGGGQLQTSSYDMLGTAAITKADLTGIISTADSFLVIVLPIMSVIIYLFSSGLRFIEISILALVGLLIKKMLNRNIMYRHTWRMAAYSVTLSTVFFMIMGALQTIVPNGAMISWLVSAIILMLAIKETPLPKK